MGKKILIVDDSPIARRMLKNTIPKDESTVFAEAGDGKAGVEKYQEFSPDVVFLDLTMPVMSGPECLKEIKKINSNAIVVVVTADIQTQVLKEVRDLGAFTVLKKPVNKVKLEETLLRIEKYFCSAP